MDKVLSRESAWSEVLRSGTDDLQRAISITGMATGLDRSVLEIGCGIGRMSIPLSEKFGHVTALDIAPRLIDEARRHQINDRISFEVCDGVHLNPTSPDRYDVVFAQEVFPFINAATLTSYLHDAYRLLAPQGQFVFQMNLQPIRWETRLCQQFRRALSALGINQWRGWPTNAGACRHYHSPCWLKQTLHTAGFRLERIEGPSLRQKWIVATKRDLFSRDPR